MVPPASNSPLYTGYHLYLQLDVKSHPRSASLCLAINIAVLFFIMVSTSVRGSFKFVAGSNFFTEKVCTFECMQVLLLKLSTILLKRSFLKFFYYFILFSLLFELGNVCDSLILFLCLYYI